MIQNVLVNGGLAESLINFRGPLLRDMVQRGWTVTATAPNRHEETERALAELGVRFRPVPLARSGMNPLKDIRYLRALVQVMKEVRPDAVLSYAIKPSVYGSMAAGLAGIPSIFSIVTGLGYPFLNRNTARGLLAFGLAFTFYRLGLRNNRVVFFQNPDDRAYFREKGILAADQDTVLVAGSGVDLEHYPPAPLPEGPPRFLLIARLVRDKGVVDYVDAARWVKKRHPEVVFDLVGPVDPNPRAIPLDEVRGWEKEGVIRYHGEATDVRPFFRESSVYVLPSYWEGTPRTVLEAMAMGRAVITTDAPGCRQTVIHGKTGFLVPVKDFEELGRTMLRFIEQPDIVGRFGAAGRAFVQQKFDARKVSQMIIEAMLAGANNE